MMRMNVWLGMAAFVLLLGSAAVRADDDILKNSTTGTPKVQSIDAIGFGPKGLLLIGDGKGSQILAIETGDIKAQTPLKAEIEKIDEKLAGKLGTTSKGIEIVDMAVNPASSIAYFAIRKQDNKQSLILTIDGAGKINEFSLEKVKYARAALPSGEKAPLTKITDIAWAGSKVLAAGQTNEQFGCKMFVVPTPIEHDAKGNVYSAETYHVSHGQWETKAPMDAIMAFHDKGKSYLIGSFACTPVVKYLLDDLQPDAKVKGVSVVELGYGNRPRHMFSYEKDGKKYILMNTHRFYHRQTPLGPSAYWTVRIDYDLLSENEKINQKAQQRVDGKFKPVTDRMKMVEEYHGVVRMDRLDENRALVLKEDTKGGLSLIPLPLP